MPPAGTLKCNWCGDYRKKENFCPKSGRCDKCCRYCTKACPYCNNIMGVACNMVGPYPEQCEQCGSYHPKCCSFMCGCGSLHCMGRVGNPLECNGQKWRRQCHVERNPECLHCSACLIKCDHTQIQECCRFCKACCDARYCSKKISITVNKMPMMDVCYCTRCMQKTYGMVCHICMMPSAVMPKDPVKSPVPRLSLPFEFRINKSRRLAGVEIECSRYKNGRMCSEVMVKHGGAMGTDGSVAAGFEARTPPANGDKLVKMLEDICGVFKEAGASAGSDAGLHVHVDASDFFVHDLRKLMMIYSRVEPALYGIIDKRRSVGQYSRMFGPGLEQAIKDPATAREDVNAIAHGTFRKDSIGEYGKKRIGVDEKGPPGWDRYHGLNIGPWWTLGTIEFRMHHGTTRPDKMINWVLLLVSMLDTANRVTDREANNWPRNEAGLLKLAPTEEVKWYVALRYQYFKEKRSGA